MKHLPSLLLMAMLASTGMATLARGETIAVEPRPITEWKAIYGMIEAQERVPARARIGGTIEILEVTEGDLVKAGQRLAVVKDDKLAFRLKAIDAQLESLEARLATAEAELKRGQELIKRGVITTQRLEQLTTEVDVLQGQIRSVEADRRVIEQQVTEGEVLAPEDGIVLDVPVSKGSVINPGEPVAIIGGGGLFLRLSLPERHADDLVEGDEIEIGAGENGTTARKGRLVKIYPQITGGRVQADVEVPGLENRFVGKRVPVRLPIGQREAILVPAAALSMTGGIDFVQVKTGEEILRRAVVPGQRTRIDGEEWIEILTGLVPGDEVVIGDE